jgi:hypothetical protein
MALGDCYPDELVNTTDLSITRYTVSDEWSDETGTTVVLASGLASIVVPNKRVFIRELESEEDARIADVILDPRTAPAGIQSKDVVRWTDFYGETTDAEVQEITRYSGIDGLESIVLKVGRRSA